MKKNKFIVGLLLGAFALAGIGTWAWRTFGKSESPSLASAPPKAGIVVYYFRTNYRCSTCMKFEALTREVVETDFSKEVKNHELAFQMVNVEEKGNEHFVRDFQLKTKSVVLVEPGRKGHWKNLDRIWNEISSDVGYKHYIQTEISSFLAGAS